MERPAAGTRRSWLVRRESERDFVDVAPAPVLAGLGGADDRMAALIRVRRRVLVRGRVAAADLPALHAHPEVHPAAADLQALLAAFDALRQGGDLDLVEVAADRGVHGCSSRVACKSVTAKSSARSVHHESRPSPAARASSSKRSLRNLALISTRSGSPSANGTSSSR